MRARLAVAATSTCRAGCAEAVEVTALMQRMMSATRRTRAAHAIRRPLLKTPRRFVRRIGGRAAGLVAIALVTLQARVREIVADIAHGFLASRLRRFVGGLHD